MNIVEENWEQILNKMKLEYCSSNISYNTWIAPLTVYEVTDDTVYILVKLRASLEHIEEKYLLPFKVCIAEVTGYEYEVSFVTDDHVVIQEKKDTAVKKQQSNAIFEQANLNPKYTFDTFVVGSNNNFAHAASLAVADSPGEIYNPLFLYGGVGLGKTHLMHSIAHFILEKDPTKKVLYVTSETFTNELIDALKIGKNGNELAMTTFREKYRNNDVLLIDDIQFIIGKESTQEEFFHTFNTLYEGKKQIIISSHKPPKDIENLEDRLISRFKVGLTVDVQPPNYETRMAILNKRAELDNIKVDQDCMHYIADNIKSNIRELEGALNQIHNFSRLKNKPITLELVKEALENIITPDLNKPVTPELIIDIVSEHFNITPQDIRGQKRSRDIAYPRQICMYLCRKMTDNSLQSIGTHLGKKDHTTIIHGAEKIEKDLQTDEALKNTIEVLTKKISPNRQ